MNKARFFLCLVLGNCGFALSANTVSEYQSLIDKWLSLHQQNNQLIADWQSHKPVLEQRLHLLEQEKSLLQDKLKQSKNQQDQVSQRRSDILSKQSQLEKNQALLGKWLQQTLNQMTSQIKQLPPPLQVIWHDGLNSLHDDASNSEKLEILLTLSAKHREFNQSIRYQKSKIKLNDEHPKLVEQLYFGDKVAILSASDGSFTGIGFVDDDQWQWQVNNAISADQFTSAKAMLEHSQAAELMTLPVQLEVK